MQLIATEKPKPPLWKAEQLLKLAEQAYKDSLEFEARAETMRTIERRMIRKAIAEVERASKHGG